MKDGSVQNDFRIRRAIPTIELLSRRGARVVLISHGKSTLAPIVPHLGLVGARFVASIADAKGECEAMQDGDVILMENIRMYEGEEQNDKKFAESLASLGTMYVNDDFATSHRMHASIIGVPKLLPSYAGLLLEDEINNLSRAFDAPHPSLLILGGAKFETKIPLIRSFLPLVDHVFVTGALMNELFHAKGYMVGRSHLPETPIDTSDIIGAENIILPTDVAVQNEKGDVRTCAPDGIHEDEMIVDIGPETIAHVLDVVQKSVFVLWNGPTGIYEDGFVGPTQAIAHGIAESTTESIIGGGDTIAALKNTIPLEQFSFVSTGGGAMIAFLLNKTLPGIDALG